MASLSKKHYEAIALRIWRHTIGDINGDAQVIDSSTFAKDLADYFASDNPRFDRTKFLQACGIVS